MNGETAGILVATSLVDYPGRVAAALFTEGCNLRCPYCHNGDIVLKNRQYNTIPFEQLYEYLNKRKEMISGFVISGGEPLLSPYLKELILHAREIGYRIKLDTNGTFPDKLERLLADPAVCPDYIALDIKTSPKRYAELAGPSLSQQDADYTSLIGRSVALVSGLPSDKREFRTVLVPNLVTENEIIDIAGILPRNALWMLAEFRQGNCLDPEYNDVIPYTEAQTNSLVSLARRFICGAQLR